MNLSQDSLMKRSRTTIMLSLVALLLLTTFSIASAFQKPGGRDPGTPTPSPRPSRSPIGSTGPKIARTRFASLTIIAPVGCKVWINNAEVEVSESGILKKEVKPGPVSIAARKPNFQEFTQQVNVLLDQPNVLRIELIPTSAKLKVSPSVDGATVEILNLDTGSSLGRYLSQNQIELPSGRYRITTLKSGYQPSMRDVTAHPGESIYLEPLLEPLPTPTPTPTPTPVTNKVPMTFSVERRDKFLVLRLQGSSGEAGRNIGSIKVTLGGPFMNVVDGNLNGLPCSVDFISLENIVEGSIIEPPGPANNWSSLVVRIRPKDEKRRPISFIINWNSLPSSSTVKTDPVERVIVPAVAIQKVQPNFPPDARKSAISGSVLVSVVIDSTGSVKSAKAIDGPFMFRRVSEEAARKWKFRPATLNGQNIESQQNLEFRFER